MEYAHSFMPELHVIVHEDAAKASHAQNVLNEIAQIKRTKTYIRDT